MVIPEAVWLSLLFGGVGAVCLWFSGWAARNEEFGKTCVFLLIAVLLFGLCYLQVFATSRNGEPITEINEGTYKVAFVYQAGENVSLGIEGDSKLGSNGYEGHKSLFYYQFKHSTFGSEIKKDAKILQVIKTGTFKKLELR